MKKPNFYAVIGKNFGDEGKGMAVDYISYRCRNKTLVIRHNGGAQSGHTVEIPGKRFVFQELSSGSFRGADTFWADTFYPDLYKLEEEMTAFAEISGFMPAIFAQPETCFTIIDDIFLNMAVENARGDARHGSCGMGIYEAKCRCESGFGISLQELKVWDQKRFLSRLQEIREQYTPKRMEKLGLSYATMGQYGEMLQDNTMLETFAEIVLKQIKQIELVKDTKTFLNNYDTVIFENGQGLLLDCDNQRFAPHVTASKTGLSGPCSFLKRYGFELKEVLYVTRSYITRHGAGPLPYERSREALDIINEDATNKENPWQGKLRYAAHGNAEEFIEAIQEDIAYLNQYDMFDSDINLLITHLNETNNCIICKDGNYKTEKFIEQESISSLFKNIYLSDTYFAEKIKEYKR
ncbi:MAG: adenylosuccinate synthetase [Lachnospiraceae bacterium]|nr:adenylosuccinate synthetase [Lachnospiraceae bacterium]